MSGAPVIAGGVCLLLVLNLLRRVIRRRRRVHNLAPAMVIDSGFRSAWHTPGRRGPHRGF